MLTVAVFLIVCAAAWSLTREGPTERPAPRPDAPNVIVVVLDDATVEMVGRRTMPIAMRELAEPGISFENFIVTSPLCCPSRAGLLTGQYGHNNNVLKNSYKRLKGKGNILPRWLQLAGYRTLHVGKYLNAFTEALERAEQVPWGWDEWFTLLDNRYYDYSVSDNGKRVRFGSGRDDYVTRVLNRRAAELVGKYARRERPFYLQLDQFAPHPSPLRNEAKCGASTTPDPDDRAAVRRLPVPRKRARNEADVSDKPAFMRRFEQLSRPGERRAETHYRCAAASLRAVDRGIGALIRELEDAGELGRTAIFLTSDNGYFFGEHRIPARKEFPYEENLRMPLLVRMPVDGRFNATRGTRTDALTANIDLAPTILELAGGRPCAGDGDCRAVDGRSLLPLIEGDQERDGSLWPRDRALYIELDQTPSGPQKRVRPCSFEGVRTADQVLIQHRTVAVPGRGCRPSDAVEHYDLEADPEQLRNLGASPRGDRDERRLRALMRRLRGCTGSEPGESSCE